MSPWITLNALCSIVVAALLSYQLILYGDRFTAIERYGLSIIAASMIINLGPALAVTNNIFHCRNPTPFDDWGGTLLRIGCVTYFGGLLLDFRARSRR